MTDDFVIRWDVESPPDENKFKIETPEYHNDVISCIPSRNGRRNFSKL